MECVFLILNDSHGIFNIRTSDRGVTCIQIMTAFESLFNFDLVLQVHDIPTEKIETGNDRLVVDDQPGSPLDPTGITGIIHM